MNQLKRFQKVFDNVYKTYTGVSGITIDGFPDGATGYGTAYNFNDKDGISYYVTAKHVLIPPNKSFHVKERKTELYNIDGESLEVKIEEVSKEYDIAILSSKSDKYASYSRPISMKELYTGETVYIVACPMGRERSVHKTNIAGKIEINGVKYIKTDKKSQKGMSGGYAGVVRNRKLRFIGILVSSDHNINITYIIPTDNFIDLLKRYSKWI